MSPPSLILHIRPARGRRRHGSRGFSLIEVVVALTILGMMTGTLFAIIQGAVRAASQIELLQRENDAINRLLEVMRRAFSTLPSAATLTLTLVDANAGDQQELLITGAPGCFPFGPMPISYSETTLSLRPSLAGRVDEQGMPLFDLCISRTDLIPQTEENRMAIGQELDGVLAQDEQGRHWMPLLPDVASMKWRFYQLSEDVWYEEWGQSNWPSLIELQILMRDRSTPIRMAFSVPALNLTTGGATLPTAPAAGGAPPPGGGGPPGGPPGGGPPPR
jgi:prepilin-type N-terminal cleavage/methylation domain-containing protein